MDIKNRNNIGLLDIGKKSMYDILTFGNIVFSYHCSISQDLYWSNIGQNGIGHGRTLKKNKRQLQHIWSDT